MAKKVDRRIQRTQELLREAMMELVAERGYEQTTVQDILDRANLGRSTFYSHFRDKDELLVSGLNHVMKEFDDYDSKMKPSKAGSVGRHSPALHILKHAAENHRLYRALIGKRGGEIVQNHLYKYATRTLGRHLSHIAPDDKHLTVPRDM